MWNNMLQSDWIKDIVDLGTTIIKTIDKLGGLETILLSIATISMVKRKQGPIAFFKELIEASNKAVINVGKKTHELSDSVKDKWGRLTESAQEVVSAEKENVAASQEASAAKDKETADLKENKEATDQNSQSKEQNTDANKKNEVSNKTASAAEDQNTQDRKENTAATNQDTQATQQNTDANKKNATSNKKVGTSIKNLGSSLVSFAKNNAAAFIAIGATLLTTLLIKATDAIVDTIDEVQEEFDNAVSELNAINSELTNLESQLADINSQIEEINNNGPLSFTDQEELSKLKAQRNELQRQIDLTNTLKEQQEYKVNSKAIDAANKYKDVGINSGKTTGEIAGSVVKGVGGAGIAMTGAAATAAAFGVMNSWNPVGWIALAAAAVTTIAGVVTYAIADSEEKVGDSIDNMKEKYEELQNEYNAARANYMADPDDKKKKKKFEEAQEVFQDYQANMSAYMSEMDSYYQQIRDNWDTATEEQKTEVNAWDDQMDAYAIQSKSKNAKTNALDRIFGENAEQELKDIKEKVIEALETGEDVNLEEMFPSKEAFDKFKQRMYDMGIYITDVEQYLKDFKKAKDEAFESDNLIDVANKINSISDALKGLKSAIKEINEKGILSANTIVSLNKIFGKTESVSDEWDNFVKIMMSGTASVLEMNEATASLTEAWLDEKLITGPISYAEQVAYAAQLEQLGVENALEWIQDKNQEAVYNQIGTAVASALTANEEEIKKIYQDESKDIIGPVKNWEDLSEEEKQKLEEAYIVAGKIEADFSDKSIQAIKDKYGTEIDNIDAVIEKLKEKAQKEQEYNGAVAAQNTYKEWLAKDNGYNQITEKIKYTSDEVKNFNASDWRGMGEGSTYVKTTNGIIEKISYDEYMKLKEAHEDYQELLAEFERLTIEGTQKGYLNEDGSLKEGVDAAFAGAITAAQEGVNKLKNEIENGLTSETKLELELEVTLGKAGSVLDEYASKMQTLASIQSEVSKSFTISAEKAKKFAMTYPEILKGAETTANGQIILNEGVVNSVLQGERAKQNAAIDTEIQNLKLQNAESEAKIKFYKTQIKVAQEAAKIGTDIAWQEAQDKLTASNVLLGYLINNGVDEETAYQTAAENMSNDSEEFRDIVKVVSEDNFTNMNLSAQGSADSMAQNASAMQDSLIAITKQAHEAAKAVAGIASGDSTAGSEEKVGGITYGTNSTIPTFVNNAAKFDGGELSEKTQDGDTPDLKTLFGSLIDPEAYKSAEEYIASLESLIASEQQNINTRNGLIQLLEGYKNAPVKSFGSGLGGSDDGNGNGIKDSEEFKNEMKYWENQIKAKDAEYQQVQNEIDFLEKQGKRAGEEYYTTQIRLNDDKIDLLTQQKTAAENMLKMFDGGSDEWWEVANQLNNIEAELDDVRASTLELSDAIAQIHWDNLEEFGKRVSNLHTELSDVRDILSSDDMFNDEGEWTEAGVATLGTYIQEIEIYKNQLKEIDDELAYFSKGYKGNETDFAIDWAINSEQEYYDRLAELNDLQRKYTKGVHESEQSVVEMYENQIDAVEDWANKAIDAYNDYIDVVRESLDAERD
jgi:hypothetical protein